MAHIREVMALGVASPLARLLGSNQLNTVIAGGVDQGSATPLTINFALLATSFAGNGVRLGCASGTSLTALRNLGPASCTIWPADGDAINGLAANLAVALPSGGVFLGVPSINQWLAIVGNTEGGGALGGSGLVTTGGMTYVKNTSGAPITVTVQRGLGRVGVKDALGNANTYPITVVAGDASPIDSAANYVIGLAYAWVWLGDNGANYSVLG
jgi:hypothetical protein